MILVTISNGTIVESWGFQVHHNHRHIEQGTVFNVGGIEEVQSASFEDRSADIPSFFGEARVIESFHADL